MRGVQYCLVKFIWCILIFPDSRGPHAWVMDSTQGNQLQDLASRLPQTILGSRAESTVKKYLSAFRRWKSWALQHKISVIPAKDHHVALYLQHLADRVGSKSAVEEACNSLAWVHSTAGLVSPTVSPFVKATLEGLQMERTMERTGTAKQDKRFLFRPICKAKSGDKLRESGCISYSCLRDLFKTKLRQLGYDPAKFGLHS